MNLGVKFRAEIAGYVTGIRFYKGPQNLGTHVGSLWSSTGTLLASATFTNETASGWQQVNFAAPVPIQANTVYVASYLAPQGRYSGDNDYFANSAVTRGVLQALQQGTSGGNGVYRYGASNAFPDSSWRSSNYWVDVVFSSDGTPPPDATAPSVTITAPTSATTFATSATPLSLGGSAADNVGVTQVTWSNDRGGSGTATGTSSWAVNGIVLATGANVITVTARDAAGNSSTDTLTVTYSAPVADTTAPTVTITSPTSAATFATSAASFSLGGSAADNVGVTQVTWSNDRGGNGTASGTTSWTANNIALQSGVNQLTVTARDAAGNTATDVLSVTYDAAAPCSGCSLWAGSATPALASSPDTGAVNLGVKFRCRRRGPRDRRALLQGPRQHRDPRRQLVERGRHAARQRDVQQRDRVGLAAGELRVAGEHHGGRHLRRVLPRPERRLCVQPVVLQQQRRGQWRAARAGQCGRRRQWCLSLRVVERVPERFVQCVELLGRRGVRFDAGNARHDRTRGDDHDADQRNDLRNRHQPVEPRRHGLRQRRGHAGDLEQRPWRQRHRDGHQQLDRERHRTGERRQHADRDGARRGRQHRHGHAARSPTRHRWSTRRRLR